MRLCVIDGRGGGVGRELIVRLRRCYSGVHEVVGLATNRCAANTMMKAGASHVVSGEWAILRTIDDADVILGPLSMVLAGAMEGEVTTELALAILRAPARKILLPLTEDHVEIVGVDSPTLKSLLDAAIRRVELPARPASQS